MIEVVAALFVENGRLLMGLRAGHKRNFPNTWDLIGGHLEHGETPLQALVREVDEELGVQVEAADAIQTFPFVDEGETGIFHLFRITRWSGAPSITNDEHTQLGWFSAAELTALQPLAFEGYREIFASALTNQSLGVRHDGQGS